VDGEERRPGRWPLVRLDAVHALVARTQRERLGGERISGIGIVAEPGAPDEPPDPPRDRRHQPGDVGVGGGRQAVEAEVPSAAGAKTPSSPSAWKWTLSSSPMASGLRSQRPHGGARHVPLNDTATAILWSLRSQFQSRWVFPRRAGEDPLNATNFRQRVFNPAVRRAGIENFRRHTTSGTLSPLVSRWKAWT
jgi:hypothetical protein